MMRRVLVAVAAGASILALTPAAAPDRPALVPSREASVLYRVVNADTASIEVRVTSEAGGSPMRIDLPDRTYMLVDQAAQRISVVVPDEQVVLDAPYQEGLQTHFQLNDRMRFTRRAPGMVATVRCTTWEVAVDNTHGKMCISDDGILLRSFGLDGAGRGNLIEAVSVSFAPAAADEFVLPAHFRHMAATPDGPVPVAPDPASSP